VWDSPSTDECADILCDIARLLDKKAVINKASQILENAAKEVVVTTASRELLLAFPSFSKIVESLLKRRMKIHGETLTECGML